jgi:hypothetical protein
MRLWLTGILLAGLTFPARAQQSGAKTDTLYYDATAQLLPSRAGAVRLIVTTARPTGGVSQKIFAANGRLLEQISYADAQARTREGLALSWFPTGELRGRRTYKAGQVEGQLLLYHPGGALQQLSVYHLGQEKSKQCFDADGQPTTCPEQTGSVVYARYRAGRRSLKSEIERSLRYPVPTNGASALRGQVVVACVIGVDGRLRESRIYKGVGPEYDREALRVVNGLRGGFAPQTIDGEPVESFYTLEVDFIPPTPAAQP